MTKSRAVERMALEGQQVDDRVVILSVRGELELYTADVFQEQVAQLALQGAERVIVDLTEASFVDSAGISALVRLQRRLAPHAELILAGARGQCLRALEIANLRRLLPLFPSVDAALAGTDE